MDKFFYLVRDATLLVHNIASVFRAQGYTLTCDMKPGIVVPKFRRTKKGTLIFNLLQDDRKLASWREISNGWPTDFQERIVKSKKFLKIFPPLKC